MNFEGQLALVTGASRGIGLAIAKELASCGARVIGTATSSSGCENISAALGDKHHAMVLNVNNTEAIPEFLQSIKDACGELPSILVNNAGITRDNLVLRMSADDWQDVIDTDLSAVFHLSKALVKPMIKARFGRIINISSVIGAIGQAGQANYAAAKAGLIGFSKSLAAEFASRNITVNVVAPGFIATDMTSDLPEAQQEQIVAQIPQKRMGSGDDIAKAVAFLASEAANYITGQTLHVNGGMFMN